MTDRIMTVATYNICHGAHADFNWDRLLSPLLGADFVGIQEVDQGTHRSYGLDTVATLKTALGLPHALFVSAMDYDGGQYGTAILSRYPFLYTAVHSLDAADCEPRAYGEAVIALPGGGKLCFINTHLSYESAALRTGQMASLAAHLRTLPADMPCIVTGDFNTDDFKIFAPLTACGLALLNHTRRRLPTFRTSRSAIDNILYDPAFLIPLAVTMPDSDASDHNPLIARFSLH